jgi:glycosyltransferase involved in cell wall biosynthesis
VDLPWKPLISIVTVVLNDRVGLENTARSVISQTYKNFEFIIVDGGSTDGTLDVIKGYNDSVRAWISEPDNGIYDAMNKGVALARGEFINFMNTGDLFYENRTLESVFRKYPQDAELIYGDCKIIYGSAPGRIKKAGNPEDLWKGMIFTHQSLFTRSSLLKEHKFDTSLAVGADFSFILNMYLDGHKFYNTGLIISGVLAGGRSDKYCLRAVTDWWRIVRKHRNNMQVNLYYSLLILKEFSISIIKKIFPKVTVILLANFRCKPAGKA